MKTWSIVLACMSMATLRVPAAWCADAAGTTAAKEPSATIMVATKSIGAGAVGVTWGNGTLTFANNDYQFSVKGLNFVDVGVASATVKGNVYELNKPADFAGTYKVATPGFPLGGEKPSWNPKDEGVTLKNSKGVVVQIWTVESGPRLRVVRGGVQVELTPGTGKPVTH